MKQTVTNTIMTASLKRTIVSKKGKISKKIEFIEISLILKLLNHLKPLINHLYSALLFVYLTGLHYLPCALCHFIHFYIIIFIFYFFILCFIFLFFSTCPYLYICNSCIFVYVYVYMCVYIYIYIYIYMYMCVCVYVYIFDLYLSVFVRSTVSV